LVTRGDAKILFEKIEKVEQTVNDIKKMLEASGTGDITGQPEFIKVYIYLFVFSFTFINF
jgi:hypothetical protein